MATLLIEVLEALLTTSKINSLEDCLKGTQISGKKACVEPQFSHLALETLTLTFNFKLFTINTTFLEYDELNTTR